MKFKLLLIVLVITSGSVKLLNAQSIASDTPVVLLSTGDPEVSEKACLMYAHA